MPDTVIRRVSERFSHVRAVRAKILYFAAKNFGRKVKSGSQLGGVAHGYSTLPNAHMSRVKTREPHRKKRQIARHFSDFRTLAETGGFQRTCYDFPRMHVMTTAINFGRFTYEMSGQRESNPHSQLGRLELYH